MSRVTTAKLLAIASSMSDDERAMAELVAKLRLVSHAQLARIFAPVDASPASAARTVRRTLARLSHLGVLARTARRIGGVRAGSAGFVYYLGPVGQRLIAYWDGQGFVRGRYRPEPGERYMRHRLAVSDLYVGARLAERNGSLDLLAFDIEPDCWRRSIDGFGNEVILKPDAFIRVGVGAYEDRVFCEVDLGTESRSVIARKLRAYLDYFHSGAEQAEHGVFPRVLLLADTESRKEALVEVCTRIPAEYWQLFAVTTLDRAIDLMTGRLEDDAHSPASGVSV